MPDLLSILGANTLTKDGLKPTEDVIKDKTAIGLYFSAYWCAPSRKYTPRLAEAYTKIYKEKDMAIIFLSGDRDEAAFDTFYAGMPWCAMPFSERDLFNQARTSYEIEGIPKLVVLSPDGKLLTKDGKIKIDKPEEYPWKFSPEEPGVRRPPGQMKPRVPRSKKAGA